jgi:hypothetical protein
VISVCLFHFQKIPPENFRYPYLYYMAGFLSLQKNERCSMAVTKAILEKWMVAQKRHRLSDKQVQMARELGLNPDKLGKIDNHRQESWKAPLPQFIESIYFKRFKREEPETVKPLKQIMAEMEAKKKLQKEKKEERRKQRALSSDSAE